MIQTVREIGCPMWLSDQRESQAREKFEGSPLRGSNAWKAIQNSLPGTSLIVD